MSKKSERKLFGSIRHMAIAKRITLLYGGIFSMSLLFLSLFMIFNISSVQQSTMRRELMDTVANIQAYLQAGNGLDQDTLTELLDNKYVEVSVYSYGEDKTYNSSVGEIPSFILPPEILPQKEPFAEIGLEEEFPYLREKDLRQGGFRVNLKRENQNGNMEYILEDEAETQFMLVSSYCRTASGVYRIQAFKMMDDGEYLVRNFMTKMLMADIIGIMCAFLIGQYISRRMLRPVAAIRAAAERISIEDLSQRISTEGPEDEMKDLTVTFNSMIDRLEAAFQRQNQFISDASHELRTPIAVIQGYANLINRWGKSDPEILQESIDSILTETDHMSALIRQLLFLAKSDQNRMNAQKTIISLNEVAAEFTRELEVVNGDRAISFVEEGQVEILADYDLIKQLLWIHGENALKYSKGGEEIKVKVWKDKKYGYVSVQDHGSGISEEDLSKIFDRFYRVDKSRNKEISGTGLGLAIARWIVDCHEGEILVESKVGEGTTFTDRFHLYQPEKKIEVKMIQR